MELRTCTYIRDDGNLCNSAAVTDRNLCLYHLDHRARLMRMAQYRARGQRYDLILPPLESMHAVQSALSQLSVALAADMIELKRADRLIRVLNLASRNLLKADKWPASPYHSADTCLVGAPSLSPDVGDRVGPVDLMATYGLPNDLDLNLSPEQAFPPPVGGPQLPDLGNCGASSSPTGNCQPATNNCSSMPTVESCTHGPGCPEHTIRADYPITPEMVEIQELTLTKGGDAAVARSRELDRNFERRQLRNGRKRYANIAMEKNMHLAAERLAERKLAERAAQETPATRKPAASVASGDTIAAKEEATA